MLQRFWQEEEGVTISIEFLLITTLTSCAVIVGWDAIRSAVLTELADVGAAVASLNQSYSFSGITGHHAQCSGSVYTDVRDTCDVCDQTPGGQALCIEICNVPATKESGE